MKKIMLFVLSAITALSLCACGGGGIKKIESASFNTPTTVNDFELTVSNDIVNAEQLNGDEDQLEEFLTTDMTNYGEDVLCDITLVAKDGNIMIVVPYSIKNNGQAEKEFNESITLNYNNGYEYEADKMYWSMGGNDDWHEYTSVKLNPLTTIMCKAQFTVPEEVVNNTEAPLKLIIANKEYSIR